MKRSSFELHSREALDGLVAATLHDPSTSSKTSYYIRNKNEIFEKWTVISTTVFLVFIGTVLLSQYPNYTSSVISKLEHSRKYNVLQDPKNFMVNMKTLTRLMNAIIFQNDMRKNISELEKVFAEVLNIQDAQLFYQINKTSFYNAIKQIKNKNYLISKALNTTSDSIKKLYALNLQSEFSIRIESIHNILKFFRDLNNSLTSLTNMIDYQMTLQTAKTVPDDTFLRDIKDHLKNLFFFEDDKLIDEHLKDGNSFTLSINQYLQLTDPFFLNHLFFDFNSLASSANKFESLSELRHNNVTDTLDVIKRLISPPVLIPHDPVLKGFPRGSNDIESLLEDVDKNRFEKLINRGKTLDGVKKLLVPLSNFKTKLAGLEKIWNMSVRQKYYDFIRCSITTYNIINSSKLVFVSNFTSNVNATLKKLTPIPGLKSSLLKKFVHLLSWSPILKTVNSELRELHEMRKNVEPIEEGIAQLKRNPPNTSEMGDELINIIQTNFTKFIKAITSKVELLKNESKNITDLLVSMTDYQNTITDPLLKSIIETVQQPQTLKLETEAILNCVEALKTVSPPINIKQDEINELSNFLFDAKEKLVEWKEFAKSFKTEIAEAQNEHSNLICFGQFPNARENAFQLAYSQHTLNFYQKTNLLKILPVYLKDGLVLGKKLEIMQPNENNTNSDVYAYFFSLNGSMKNILNQVYKLPLKLTIEGHDLEKTEKIVSSLDEVLVSGVDFSHIILIIERLKWTEIGQWHEFAKIEKSLKKLENIQYAVLRTNKTFSSLLAEAEGFLQCLSAKSVPYDYPRVPYLMIFVSLVALAFTSLIIWGINWFRKFWEEVERQTGYDKY